MSNISLKSTTETFAEQTLFEEMELVLLAARSRSSVSGETTYFGRLSFGSQVLMQQNCLILADGSAETLVKYHSPSNNFDILRLTADIGSSGDYYLKGDFNGAPLSPTRAPEAFRTAGEWSSMKSLPATGFNLSLQTGSSVEFARPDQQTREAVSALLGDIERNPNKVPSYCALGVMAGAMGLAIATGGAGAGLIIAGQLIGSAICTIP